jgi:CheY-like chemotaxis protein
VTVPFALLVGLGAGLIIAGLVAVALGRWRAGRARAEREETRGPSQQPARPDQLEESGRRDSEPGRQPGQVGQKQAEREVAAVWLQFLRREVADTVSGVNNRLTVIKTLAHNALRTAAPDLREGLQKILQEVDRAANATATLHQHVSSAAPPPAPASVNKERRRPNRAGAILIVDSDDGVREVIGQLFQSLGHRVVPARDGIEGLEILRSERVDCVITATYLSRLSGVGFYTQVEQLLPFACRRFVFICGETQRPDVRAFLEKTGCPIIPKPFDVTHLVDVVEGVIARVVHDPANRRTGGIDAADRPTDLPTADPAGEPS